ncbi:BTB/POZ protein [Ochromonadaceae sp. CCMP2298]|nr:BTB/POZ protein [Ochromonadaceae sp. CCMP2298]
MNFSDPGSIVNLNVGGVRFTTQLKTLRRFPETVLEAMFSGKHALPKGEDGCFFIDRDGTHFRHILNFLVELLVLGADEKELRRESKYYGIDDLMFSGTQTRLAYQDMRGLWGTVPVLVDVEGVYTIHATGEPIVLCPNCRLGSFSIGAEYCKISSFGRKELPVAQPAMRCPTCS